jgi:hypothetical protein
MYFYVPFSLSAFSIKVSNSVTQSFIATVRSIAVEEIEDHFQIMSSRPLLVLVRLHEGNSSHPWYDILDSSRMTNPDKLSTSMDSVIPAHHPRPVQRNWMAASIKS